MFKKQITAEHVIDIDTRGHKFSLYEKEPRSIPLIQQIHQHICDKNKHVYEPDILSIGPYHYGAPRLHTMQNIKIGYLNYILKLNQEKKLEDYLEAINVLEKQARSRYVDEFKMDKTDFVKMLLLDGCFILLACCGLNGILSGIKTIEDGSENIIIDENKDASVLSIEGMDAGEENSYETEQLYTRILLRDVLLLENQIPFFVISKIFEVFTAGKYPISVLVSNFVLHIEEAFGQNARAIKKFDEMKEIYHLLHLCHMYFKPIQIEVECSQNQVKCRGATQYNEARIELKKKEFCIEKPHFLLDIRFCKGTLEVPSFAIDWQNYDILRNLIAFEQTCPHFGKYITMYVVFLSQFISTINDVALLIEKDIIARHLHSDREISNLFRSLGDNIDFDLSGDNYLQSICNMMEEHYHIWRPKWRKWLASITSNIHTFGSKNKSELPL